MMNLKTKLAYMALGGVLVLAGHVLPGLVVGSATAQGGLQDAEFDTVTAKRVRVGDDDGAWVLISAGKAAAAVVLRAGGAGSAVIIGALPDDVGGQNLGVG